jgi:hypothetical protein
VFLKWSEILTTKTNDSLFIIFHSFAHWWDKSTHVKAHLFILTVINKDLIVAKLILDFTNVEISVVEPNEICFSDQNNEE